MFLSMSKQKEQFHKTTKQLTNRDQAIIRSAMQIELQF